MTGDTGGEGRGTGDERRQGVNGRHWWKRLFCNIDAESFVLGGSWMGVEEDRGQLTSFSLTHILPSQYFISTPSWSVAFILKGKGGKKDLSLSSLAFLSPSPLSYYPSFRVFDCIFFSKRAEVRLLARHRLAPISQPAVARTHKKMTKMSGD